MFSNCCLAAEKMRENFNESTSVVENWVFRYPSAWTKWCKVPIFFFFLNQMLCLAEESESKTKKKKKKISLLSEIFLNEIVQIQWACDDIFIFYM